MKRRLISNGRYRGTVLPSRALWLCCPFMHRACTLWYLSWQMATTDQCSLAYQDVALRGVRIALMHLCDCYRVDDEQQERGSCVTFSFILFLLVITLASTYQPRTGRRVRTIRLAFVFAADCAAWRTMVLVLLWDPSKHVILKFGSIFGHIIVAFHSPDNSQSHRGQPGTRCRPSKKCIPSSKIAKVENVECELCEKPGCKVYHRMERQIWPGTPMLTSLIHS